MEVHAWFIPTLERLVGVMNYPDKANEFASAKVTPTAAHQVIYLLTRHMPAYMRAPRIEPTAEGGLRCEWNEYWVDCSLLVSEHGFPQVHLLTHGVSLSESASGFDEGPLLLEKAFRLIDELLRSGPPVPHPKG